MSRYRARFLDPTGAVHGTPTYPWRMAPDGLATRRQLRAADLSPGGQPVVAQVMWHRHNADRVAYLYRVGLARPKRIPTPAQLRAVALALAARRWCPDCGRDAGYVLPIRYGTCWACVDAAGRAA
jgi:hypothetical protein